MKRNAPLRAGLAGVAFAVVTLILPPVFAGGNGAFKPDMRRAERMKRCPSDAFSDGAAAVAEATLERGPRSQATRSTRGAAPGARRRPRS